MTAVAIALLSLVLPGKDKERRLAEKCRPSLPVCASLVLPAGCDDKQTEKKDKAKPDRSALAAGGAAFIVRVDPAADGAKPVELTIVQAAMSIQKRLNPKGTRRVFVTPVDGCKLLVEAAGLTVEEAEASKPIIQCLGKLEFRLLGPEGIETTTKEDATIKPDHVKLRYLDGDKADGGAGKAEKYLWVKNKAELSGKSVKYAGAQISPGASNFHINIELHDEFGEKMRTISKANLGKPMAIILDGEVISAPTIQGEFGANFQITGSFTEAEAESVASQLMNPLENPLIVEKITAIPPTASGKK